MGWLVAAGSFVINLGKDLLGKAGQLAASVQLVAAVLYHGKDLRSFLSRNNPLVANFLSQHVSGLTETLTRAQDLATNVLATETMAGHDEVASATDLASITRAAADVEAAPAKVAAARDAHAPTMTGVAAEAEGLLQNLIKGILDIYTDTLQQRRGELPGGVNNVGAAMVSKALKFGLTAQLSAFALELAYFTKNTGLNQLVGYLANFAGFDRITAPLIGPQLRWGLGIPAEQQAAKLFRTRIPSAREVQEQAVQRHATANDYRHALQLEGLPEDWIDVLVADMYVDPRAREIITLVEGVDVDPAWLTAKFREVGWDDEDVKRAVAATARRARKPATDRYLRTISTSYLHGFLPLDQLGEILEVVNGDEGYRRTWIAALESERAHRNAEELADAILEQFGNSVLGPAATDEMLEALGFQPAEVTRRRVVAQLKRNERLLRQDVAEVEGVVRQLRSQALTALRAELRAGRLSATEFALYVEMLGYAASFAAAIADLEQLKQRPAATQPVATVGLEKLTTTLTDLGDVPLGADGKPLPGWTALATAGLANLKAHLRAGTLKRAEFITLGQLLGLAPLTLEQLADVELLRATPSPAVLASSDAAALAHAAHVALTDLAADLVERRVIAASSAIALLAEAGVPVGPATAAIAIAEVLAGTTDELTVWPFQNLEDKNLVWTTVAGELATALADAGTVSGPLGKILGAVGKATKVERNALKLRDNLQALFGVRRRRTRAAASTERIPSPTPLPVPAEDVAFRPTGPTGGGTTGSTGEDGPTGPDELV